MSKLKKKPQNSSKKLKVWEDFSAPEVPSGVIKKACYKYSCMNTTYFTKQYLWVSSNLLIFFSCDFFETWQLEASFLILIFSTVYVQNVEKSLGLSHFYFHYLLLVWTKLSDRYTVLFLLFNLILFEILSCTLLFLCRGLNSFDFPFIEAAKNQRVPTQKGARLIC